MGYEDELVRVQAQVKEIEQLETWHAADECQRYAPGRCPSCSRIRAIEEEIERALARVEEDVAYALEEGHPVPVLFDGVKSLASLDVSRCHARGKWPLSLAEAGEADMLERMLARRLEVKRLAEGQQKRLHSVLVSLVRCYQEQYYASCLQRWPLAHFQHCNSPLQAGDLPIDWAAGFQQADMQDMI